MQNHRFIMFLTLYSKFWGIQYLSVISRRFQTSFTIFKICLFQPLDSGMQKDLEAALKGFLQQGETLFLETKVW